MRIRCRTLSDPSCGEIQSFDPGVHASIPQVTLKIEALRREGSALSESLHALQSTTSIVLPVSDVQALLARHKICVCPSAILAASNPKGMVIECLKKKKNELAIVHDVLCRRLTLLSSPMNQRRGETHLHALSQGSSLDRELQRDTMHYLYDMWKVQGFISIPRELLFRAMVAVRMERDALAETLERKEKILEGDVVEYFSLDVAARGNSISSLEEAVRARLMFVTDYLKKLREDYLRVFEGRIISQREKYIDILHELPPEAREAGSHAGNLEDLLLRVCQEELSSSLLKEISEEIPSISLDIRGLSFKELLSMVQYELAVAQESVEEYLTEYEKREYLSQVERLPREELEEKRRALQEKCAKNREKTDQEREQIRELFALEQWRRREHAKRLTYQEEQLVKEEKELRKRQLTLASQYPEGIPAAILEEERIAHVVHEERKKHIERLARASLHLKKSSEFLGQPISLRRQEDSSQPFVEQLQAMQSSLELQYAVLARQRMQKQVLDSMLCSV